MKTLAEVVVFLMEQLTTADEPGIDWQACGDLTNDMWFALAEASPTERRALAEAASGRLREVAGGVRPMQREFLQSLADGSAWHEFDHPEAPDAAQGTFPLTDNNES